MLFAAQPTRYHVVVLTSLPPGLEKLCTELFRGLDPPPHLRAIFLVRFPLNPS